MKPTCTLAAWLLASSLLAAADVPAISVRIASYERLNRALNYVVNVSGYGTPGLELTISHPQQDQLYGIASVDDGRPTTWVVLLPEAVAPWAQVVERSVWIVPVKHVDRQFVFGVMLQSGGVRPRPKPVKVEDGLYRWDRTGQEPIFVRIHDDVALIGQDQESIAAIGDRLDEFAPQTGAPDLFTIRCDWRNVPSAWKQPLRDYARTLLTQRGADGQVSIGNALIGLELAKLLDGCESLTTAIDVSPADRRARWTLSLAARPDSPLDSSFALFSLQPTRFAALLERDAVTKLAFSLRMPAAVTKSLNKVQPPKWFTDSLDDPANKTRSQETRDLIESMESVYRGWLTMGRLDAVWSTSHVDGKPTTVIGCDALGAEALDETVAAYLKPSATGGEISLAAGERAHRLPGGLLAVFARDAIYLAHGTQAEDILSFAVASRADESPPARIPSVLIEAQADDFMKFLGESWSKMSPAAKWTPGGPLKGRFRFAIERGEHDVTTSFDLDEALLETCAKPVVKAVSDKLGQAALAMFRGFGVSSASGSDPPADAERPENRPQN